MMIWYWLINGIELSPGATFVGPYSNLKADSAAEHNRALVHQGAPKDLQQYSRLLGPKSWNVIRVYTWVSWVQARDWT